MKVKWNGPGNVSFGSEVHAPGTVLDIPESVFNDLDDTVKHKFSNGEVKPVAKAPAKRKTVRK